MTFWLTAAELDLDVSTSFVEVLDADASWIIEPFFTRLAPAVVETFHTSYVSKRSIKYKGKLAGGLSARKIQWTQTCLL